MWADTSGARSGALTPGSPRAPVARPQGEGCGSDRRSRAARPDKRRVRVRQARNVYFEGTPLQFALRDRGITTLAICVSHWRSALSRQCDMPLNLGIVPLLLLMPALRVTRKRKNAASISYVLCRTYGERLEMNNRFEVSLQSFCSRRDVSKSRAI
jgi:hypothetical protein